MADDNRPQWQANGAQVYSVSFNETVQERWVVRATATQLIVEDENHREERYRRSDLGLVGGDHRSPKLAPPDSFTVLRALERQMVRVAMGALRQQHDYVTRGARIWTDELSTALDVARRLRDAAQFAIESMTGETQ